MGVVSAKLMVSNRIAAAWFGATVNSSLDMENRSELLPCSGETSTDCISMSMSWDERAFLFINCDWWFVGGFFSPSSL